MKYSKSQARVAVDTLCMNPIPAGVDVSAASVLHSFINEAGSPDILTLEIDTKKVIKAIHGVEELLLAAQEFVARVDKGEIRSQHTYGRFKKAIAEIEANAGKFDESAIEFRTPVVDLNDRGMQDFRFSKASLTKGK